jgi:hypothetical protein
MGWFVSIGGGCGGEVLIIIGDGVRGSRWPTRTCIGGFCICGLTKTSWTCISMGCGVGGCNWRR